MKLLYLPNEKVPGWQVGARTAFAQLHERGVLDDVETYSFLQTPPEVARAEILELARRFGPDVIVATKIGRFPIDDAWLRALRATPSKPRLVYYDGDIYGRVFKRLTPATRAMCRHADVVYLCGMGNHARMFEAAGAREIRYLPHNASAVQFGRAWEPTAARELDVVLIGNRIRGRIELQDRIPWARMPGAYDREQLVRRLGDAFGTRFAVYGTGWDGFAGARGPIAFERQHDAIRRSWISVGYDHFPGTPLYFSDRLPIALLAGVAHVAHYHPGYETMFAHGRELLWARTLDGVVDTVRDALARGPAYLDALGARGRAHALAHLTSETVYRELVA
jgi:hypothetical protein